jgi:hypothetical protein
MLPKGAFAQAPVPPVSGDPAKKERRPVEPGFETPSDQSDAQTSPKKPEPDQQKPKSKGRQTGLEEEQEDLNKPVSVPDQGNNEHLVEDMNATTGEVTLGQIIDEILADVISEIDTRSPKLFTPMAIRQIALGANVNPSYAKKLQAHIVAQIHAGTKVKMVQCVECEVVRTRLEGKQWVVTKGITTTEEMRAIADKLGIKSFMDVAFGFDPETAVLEMDFRVIGAQDGHILWSETFRADETTPMLMRSSEAPQKRKDRLHDLEMLLEGRPYYGYVATAGFMIIPYNDPTFGDIYGATAGYRIYERFGVERRVMFGLDLTGFLNIQKLAGGVISAGSWWIPIRPDFINPELRLGAKAGAFVAGSAGNAAVFQLGAEVILRYRFGLYAYVLFMTKSTYPQNSMFEIGGVGGATGMSFNW